MIHNLDTMSRTNGPSANAPRKFDAMEYKQVTRDQWQLAAEAWHRWNPLLSDWLDDVTLDAMGLADMSEGDRVLDLAAGAGGQTLLAARCVGSSGYVLATDISRNLLDYALAEAKREGILNVEFREMDGEEPTVPDNNFDVIFSRLGLTYFPDQHKALARMHRALKPGGRVVNIVYSTAEKNAFYSIPLSVIRRRAQLPPPAPGQPEPFSLGSPGVLEAAYWRAGFVDIRVQAFRAPLKLESAAECVRFVMQSFGALNQMLSGLTDAEKDDVWDEIKQELRKFETRSGFVGPCELLVGVGLRA